jgi:response regulator RpfG family c-di-GMP phosphodiesterase
MGVLFFEVPGKLRQVHIIILELTVDDVVFRLAVEKVVGNKLLVKRILVVDNSSVIRGIFAKIFTQKGAEVELPENGYLAVGKHQAFSPYVTIMDINILQMGGLDPIVRMKESDPETKFILQSSQVSRES